MDALLEVNVFWDDRICICIVHPEEAQALPSRPIGGTDKLTPLNPRFHVAPSGKSGLGMFASLSGGYDTGDLIWEERPIVIMPNESPKGIFGQVWKKLPARERGCIMDLRNAHMPDVDPFEGRLRTNFIGIELAPNMSPSYRGLFPVISRANHSCASNATYQFHNGSFALELRAARRIESGEEIHIQYIDVLQPRGERKRLLRELYMFDCQCPSCGLPEGSIEGEDSDRRRELIRTWAQTRASLNDWLYDTSLEKDLIERESKELLGLISQEGLEAMQRYALDMLCASLASLAREQGLLEWARKARKAAKIGGDEHPMVLYYGEIIQDPKSSHLWDARRKLGDDEANLWD